MRGEFLLQPVHSRVQLQSSSNCRTCLFPDPNPLPFPRPCPRLNPCSMSSATAGMSKSWGDNSFGSLVLSAPLQPLSKCSCRLCPFPNQHPNPWHWSWPQLSLCPRPSALAQMNEFSGDNSFYSFSLTFSVCLQTQSNWSSGLSLSPNPKGILIQILTYTAHAVLYAYIPRQSQAEKIFRGFTNSCTPPSPLRWLSLCSSITTGALGFLSFLGLTPNHCTWWWYQLSHKS